MVNNYPTVRSDDILREVSAANYITTVDCTTGYWSIKVKETDIYKTAFVTDRGHYEWLAMPFGLKCAGNTFQRAIDTILRPHSRYAKAYVDDVATYSGTWAEHLCHLDAVLGSLKVAGMTLKLTKCVFAQAKVKFVGHYIGSGEMQVVQSKVEAIERIPECTNKKLLRSFLGMVSYFRSYIPNFSEIALPLTELTKGYQSNNLKFNDVQREAFNKLKSCLCNSEVLMSPCCNKPYIICCDASDYAIGACLSQKDDFGSVRPVAYASAKLTDVQRRWSVIEKEAYAVIFALQRFDVMVFGNPITLYIDHNPLQFLVSSVPRSTKLTRWALALQRYNITAVIHKAGKDNLVADGLSRL